MFQLLPDLPGLSAGRLGAPRSIFDIVYQSTPRPAPDRRPNPLASNRPINFLYMG